MQMDNVVSSRIVLPEHPALMCVMYSVVVAQKKVIKVRYMAQDIQTYVVAVHEPGGVVSIRAVLGFDQESTSSTDWFLGESDQRPLCTLSITRGR